MPHLIEENVDANDPAFLYLNLHPGEEVKLIVRHHWAGFLGTIGIVLAMAVFPLLVLLVAMAVFKNSFDQALPFIIIAFSGYYIFLLTFLFGSWVNYYYDILFITNKRILNVDQEGLLSRKISELSMGQIQNVTAEVTGFLQSFFNYGILIIETAGEGTSSTATRPGTLGYFTITEVPDPNRLARIVLELHRQTELDDDPEP